VARRKGAREGEKPGKTPEGWGRRTWGAESETVRKNCSEAPTVEEGKIGTGRGGKERGVGRGSEENEGRAGE